MQSIDLLFFYLVDEEVCLPTSGDVVGYIRIADLNTKKPIERIEVTNIVETFERLKKCLLGATEPLVHRNCPESNQCFAIRWTDALQNQITAEHDKKTEVCLLCRDVVQILASYRLFLKQSNRMAAIR